MLAMAERLKVMASTPMFISIVTSNGTPVLRLLLLLFIIMPVLEMWVLIKVGGVIGPWPTIGLVLLTAAVGYSLLRQQGFATLMRGQQRMHQGELPASEMLEGLMLAISGALLLTPGFVTDAIGFLGLVSPLRAAVARRFLGRVGRMEGMSMASRTFTVGGRGERFGSRSADAGSGNIYEGEVADDLHDGNSDGDKEDDAGR